jgi:hypothetical protein
MQILLHIVSADVIISADVSRRGMRIKREVVIKKIANKILGIGWGGFRHSRAKVITFPQSELG